MEKRISNEPEPAGAPSPADFALMDVLLPLIRHAWLITLGALSAGLLAIGASFLLAPTFTAATTFIPPQQAQSAAASALSSLGALSNLAGAAGIKSPGEQYISLLRSVTVADRLIDRFGLMAAYDVKYRFRARQELARNVRITMGKKDGLITVEVEDTDPQRAADLANRHVDELRRFVSELALTEAQQRRGFFEAQLKETRNRLTQAQQALQNSGFNQGALRAEPRAASEAYARLKAEITASEVRLSTLRSGFADATPEVQTQLTRVVALRAQLLKLEASDGRPADSDYIGRYREYKYQETLFELFSRQYELARLDESKEGSLIQVVDLATAAELKSKPKRALIAMATTAFAFFVLASFVVLRQR